MGSNMAVWAIADLHLSFGIPNKAMDVFGPQWQNWTDKIEKQWRDTIQNDDLVLIAGDISWAMRPQEAAADLEWIHHLPGTKVILRGNHDYWWTSLAQIEKVLPSSIHLIQNNVFNWNNVSVGGTRLWDTPEYTFRDYIEYQKSDRPTAITKEENPQEAEKIFQRELLRLELSLKCLSQDPDKIRIAMVHYPPIGAELHDSQTSKILEKYHVQICVFGHLHNVRPDLPMFGNKNGIDYYLTACDYLNFKPLKLLS